MPAPVNTVANKPPLTPHLLKAFYEGGAFKLALAALASAKARAAVVVPHVLSYTVPLLAQYGITEDRGGKSSSSGKPCTNPERVYMCMDEDAVQAYFAACSRAHKANGYDVPEGNCPSLMAQNDVIKAESALLKLAADVLGVDVRFSAPALRAKALELFTNPPCK